MGETRAVEPSLIVTDLDGTLWHTDDEVHGDVVKALGRVLESGPPLLVATGRRVTSTRVPLARIGVAPAAIVLNGALGLDLTTDVRFHRAPYHAAEGRTAAGQAGGRRHGVLRLVQRQRDMANRNRVPRPSVTGTP